MKKRAMAAVSAVMCASMVLSACGSSASTSTTAAPAETKAAEESKTEETTAAAASGDVVTINIGFENTTEEPIGQAVEKWAELLKEESNGTMELKVFANSALGNKSKLIDQMVMGENVITIADGAFYADYGVPDLGILYGPFFFDNWDEVWKLIDSDWYKEQCSKLADKGLTVLGSNWVYGERELMTKDKAVVPADIKGKKIRLANSQIYVEGFNALGATAVPMALGDVYTALQNGTLDGVENPLSTLYGQSFQEVTKNILMTGHILNFTTWCIGTDYLNTLTQEQQDLLFKTCEEAGLYNNEKQEAANDDYRKKLEDAGADFILICSNTIHKVTSQIASMLQIPVVHIADATADELKTCHIKRVGLLGTRYTMKQDFYKDRLSDRGIEVIIPDDVDVDVVNRIIFEELCVGKINEKSRKIFQKIIEKMQEKGAEGVILGCTEIGLLIHQSDVYVPVFDTTVIHAKKVVQIALTDS